MLVITMQTGRVVLFGGFKHIVNDCRLFVEASHFILYGKKMFCCICILRLFQQWICNITTANPPKHYWANQYMQLYFVSDCLLYLMRHVTQVQLNQIKQFSSTYYHIVSLPLSAKLFTLNLWVRIRWFTTERHIRSVGFI